MEDIKRGKIQPELPNAGAGPSIPRRPVFQWRAKVLKSRQTLRTQPGRVLHNEKLSIGRERRPAITSHSRAVEISLNLQLIMRIWRAIAGFVRPRKRAFSAIAGGLVASSVLVLVIFGYVARRENSTNGRDTQGSQQGTNNGPVLGTPSYKTVLPAGKSVAQLGGWYLVSPPGRDPVYAYSDKIGTIKIDVSEQPLPDSFQASTAEKIAELAHSFNASQRLSADGLTVYIGTSAAGPQSIIFTQNGLLILIKSSSVVSNDQWIQYITSLK